MSKNLLTNVTNWISANLNITIYLDKATMILGYLHKNNYQVPLNTILLTTKSFIFQCSRKNNEPDINTLIERINKTYIEQQKIAILNQSLNQFNKVWSVWKNLF